MRNPRARELVVNCHSAGDHQSYYAAGTIATVAATAIPAGWVAYDLKTSTLAAIGIPSSIALPMQLVFQ